MLVLNTFVGGLLSCVKSKVRSTGFCADVPILVYGAWFSCYSVLFGVTYV